MAEIMQMAIKMLAVMMVTGSVMRNTSRNFLHPSFFHKNKSDSFGTPKLWPDSCALNIVRRRIRIFRKEIASTQTIELRVPSKEGEEEYFSFVMQWNV